MLTKTTMTSFLFLLALCWGASGQCLAGDDNPPMMSRETMSAMNEARYGFALDSLRKAATIESRDNVFYSPYSLHQALTLAYFGARGATEAAVKSALHVPDDLSKVEVRRDYSLVYGPRMQQEGQQVNPNYEYRSANRLWLSSARKLRDCMFNFFGAELEAADFRADPEAVRRRINEWVSNATKNQIRDLLPDGAVGEDTDLVLANAVYFKGLWKSKFDPAMSKRDIFYGTGGRNTVTTFMNQKRTFNHVVSEELGAHILELPYKGDDISMYVLLPPYVRSSSDPSSSSSEPDGTRQLVERIATEAGARELRDLLDDGMPPREVEVKLPRFALERELPLAQLLRAMGAGVLVEPNAADLRGFVADGEPSPRLGDAVHRARIQVDEEGTTAAAATALLSFRSSRPSEPAVFNANHPFVYLIYDKTARNVLFAGVFRTPATASQPGENANV